MRRGLGLGGALAAGLAIALVPAQVMPRIKRVGMRSWAEERCEDAAHGSRLRVDGQAAELRVEGSRAVTRDGQAGLPTLRVECELGTPLPPGHRAHRPLRCGRRTSRTRVAGSHRPGGSDDPEGI